MPLPKPGWLSRPRDGDGVTIVPAQRSNSSSSNDDVQGGKGGGAHFFPTQRDGAAAVSLWSPDVAAAMGYGKGCVIRDIPPVSGVVWAARASRSRGNRPRPLTD